MDTSINKHALTFGLITVFLTGLGLTIVSPVLPFLVKTGLVNIYWTLS
jgi:MFS transporter, DHA1 family, tetracycline resistance protein